MAGTKIGNQMKRGVSISKQKNKKEGSVLDRLGFLMLSILAGNSAVDKTSAMTVKEILEIENVVILSLDTTTERREHFISQKKAESS